MLQGANGASAKGRTKRKRCQRWTRLSGGSELPDTWGMQALIQQYVLSLHMADAGLGTADQVVNKEDWHLVLMRWQILNNPTNPQLSIVIHTGHVLWQKLENRVKCLITLRLTA